MRITAHGAKSGVASLVYIGLVVVAIVLVNLIAGRSTARIDLTADQRFTLDDASITTAAELPGPVGVEVFMSSNLPAPLEQMRRDLNDLLAEYEAYSDGQLTYEFIDPEATEEFEERAAALSIPSWPVQQRSESDISQRFIYAGLAFVYDDGSEEQVETIDQLLPGMNYEYELTRSLSAVVREGGPPRLGILVGDGGLFSQLLDVPFNPQQPVNPAEIRSQYAEQLGQLFENLYEFEFVDLNEGPISHDIDGLFIFGPTAELDDDQLYDIDQYILSGRPVALSVSPYRMEALQFDQPGFENVQVPALNTSGLDRLLESYGVMLRKDAVFDFEAAQVSAERRQIDVGGLRGSTWIPYLDPRLPEITNISETSVLVPNMNLLGFLPLDRSRPLSQSTLELTASAVAATNAGGLRVDRVLQTADTAYRMEPEGDDSLETLGDSELASYAQAYEQDPEDPGIDLERGPFTVALTIEGSLESAFPDRGGEDEATDEEGGESEEAGGHLASTDDARVFVIANGYWVEALLASRDPLLSGNAMLPPQVRGAVQQYHQSLRLLLRNTADWLAQDSALVNIRARGQVAFFDAGSLADSEKTFYKLFNIAGVPAVFCFIGLCGFLIRQARRSSFEQRYGRDA